MSARGDLVKFTGEAGIKAKVEGLVGPLKSAHKDRFTRNKADKLAHMIGVLVLANCPACSTGQRCEEHRAGVVLEKLELDPGPPESAPDPSREHQAVVDHYFEAFKKERKRRPALVPLDFKAAKELLDRHGLDEAKALIDAMFAHNWGKDNGNIQLLNKNPSMFISGETGSKKRGGPLQVEGA